MARGGAPGAISEAATTVSIDSTDSAITTPDGGQRTRRSADGQGQSHGFFGYVYTANLARRT